MIVETMMFDSGSSDHVTDNLEGMTNLRENSPKCNIVGARNDFLMACPMIGDLNVVTMNRYGELQRVTLQNTLYAPEINTKLMSEDKMTKNGANVFMSDTILDIHMREDPSISIFVGVRINRGKRIFYVPENVGANYSDEELLNLPEFVMLREILQMYNFPFCYSVETNQKTLLPTRTELEEPRSDAEDDPAEKNESTMNEPENIKDVAMKWHRRLGHISASYLRLMPKVVEGIPNLKLTLDSFRECSVCIRYERSRRENLIPKYEKEPRVYYR